jgi:NAD-dependent deacetylase
MEFDFDQKISAAAELINESKYTIILSGAGLSTSSGIPDFRSKNTGLWEINDPMRVASLSTFLKQPEVFFNWLQPLAREIYNAQPNPAHLAITTLQKNHHLKVIITQNIDSLHQKAGSENVIEVHGSTSYLECLKCKIKFPFDDDSMLSFIEDSIIPTCKKCNRYLKPSIILFEEMLPYDAWDSALQNCEKADLVIVIGSSLEVSPVNQLPMIAKSNGAKLIINTFSPTPMDYKADLLLHYDIVEVWEKILEKLENSS